MDNKTYILSGESMENLQNTVNQCEKITQGIEAQVTLASWSRGDDADRHLKEAGSYLGALQGLIALIKDGLPKKEPEAAR